MWTVDFSGFRDVVSRFALGGKEFSGSGFEWPLANLFCLCMQAPFILVVSLNLSSTKSLGLTSSIDERKYNEAI